MEIRSKGWEYLIIVSIIPYKNCISQNLFQLFSDHLWDKSQFACFVVGYGMGKGRTKGSCLGCIASAGMKNEYLPVIYSQMRFK